jgi:hypothetical protein
MVFTRPTGALPRNAAIEAALEKMQPPGSGFNTSLCTVANAMKYAAVGFDMALQMALQHAADLGVPSQRHWEITRAFEKIYQDNSTHIFTPTEPSFARIVKNVQHTEALCRIGPTAKDIKRLSPIDPSPLTTWEIIRKLYPERNTLLCVGESQDNGRVVMRDGDLHLSRCQFIVPSPMTARTGINQKGELTCRSLGNTGPRRFLVVECDFSRYDRSGENKTVWHDVLDRMESIGCGSQDMCASVISELSMCGIAPEPRLAMVVSSGGKSLHAWFYVAGRSDAELRNFFSYACSLGADHVTWNRCQWVRMPAGSRVDEGALTSRRQSVFYFDPAYAG